MNESLGNALRTALAEKKLNQKAHDEIVRWLTGEEFAEFAPELSRKIEGGEWEFLMDAFYRTLSFGTAGLRGVMDIGTNRMNNYMSRWASQAFAQYLLKYKSPIAGKGVAIAYDSRFHSEEFMKETARVLAANGIPVFIFDYYRATPELSFAVRHLGLAGGIVITSSHNPPEFNGYKVYDENGIQVLPEAGVKIEAEFNAVAEIKKMAFDDAVAQNLVRTIGKETDAAFADAARQASAYPGRNASIVFSPLHGVGSQSVLPVLKALGFSDISPVEEQMPLDGAFPTVKGHFPNPEFAIVYEPAIALAKEKKADIAIVSDPDADRLGIAAPDASGDWRVFNGNQTATLLAHFHLTARKDAGAMPENPVMIKTSVTTELLRDIAEKFGAEMMGDLLVGFKFIGDRIQNLPADKRFIMGCEESCGYLFTDAYRDKGAETPAVVAAEMASWCKEKKISIPELLESVYREYGYYAEHLEYRLIEGLGAIERMNAAMKKLRGKLPAEIGDRPVVKTMDRLSGEVRDGRTGALIENRKWDKGDMLSFFFDEDERNSLHIRPSGTEPKMKYYAALKGPFDEKKRLDDDSALLANAAADLFEKILSDTGTAF